MVFVLPAPAYTATATRALPVGVGSIAVAAEAPESATPPPAMETTGRTWWMIAGNLLLLGLLGGGAIAIGRRLLHPHPDARQRTVPHGRLVPANNRTRRISKPLDLRAACLRRNKMRLLLGRGKDADVVLLHDDVQARHAWIAVLRDPDTAARLSLVPVEGASVAINNRKVASAVDLQDGDTVQFGTLRFIFEMAELYRPVVVERLDGTRVEGFPLEWDTTAPGFKLRPRDGSAVDPPVVVPFDAIRAVHFVTDWDADLAALLHVKRQYPAGSRVCLRFCDGVEWRGSLTADHHPDMPRFHFLPDDIPGVIVSLIERGALASVAVIDA